MPAKPTNRMMHLITSVITHCDVNHGNWVAVARENGYKDVANAKNVFRREKRRLMGKSPQTTPRKAKRPSSDDTQDIDEDEGQSQKQKPKSRAKQRKSKNDDDDEDIIFVDESE